MDMTKVPLPQEDNSVQSLALALSKSVISQVPVAGNLINEFIEKTNQKLIAKGHKIFLEEVSRGQIDLSDREKEEFIPIGYRYYLAARDGTVNRNLRLLAKLIRKQIDENDLSYEKYITLDNAIRDLSLEEMIALSELCKKIHQLDWVKKGYEYSYLKFFFPDFQHVVKAMIDDENGLFEKAINVETTFALLAGKGLVIQFGRAGQLEEKMVPRGLRNIYAPSLMAISIAKVTIEIDI